MELKKFRAMSRDWPWLSKSIWLLASTNYRGLKGVQGSKEEYLEKWAIENISEIVVRLFRELDLDQRNQVSRMPFGPPSEKISFLENNGYRMRSHIVVFEIRFQIVNYRMFEERSCTNSAYNWVSSCIYAENSTNTVRECLRSQMRTNQVSGLIFKNIKPFVIDAVVRITKVGIYGRCYSFIIDIYPFPKDFDYSTL